jgi:ParB family chromosome partitioning protein
MKYVEIPLDKIKLSKEQPRQEFDEERLKQLAESIKEVGQLQPIIVQKKGDEYTLISGERRYRAIKKEKARKKIAAVVLEGELKKENLRQIQLIENLQRQDLNPLERAISIQRFIDDNELTKKDASKKIGVPRTTLTEWLNILDVGENYQKEVLDEDSPLSLSHITLATALANRTGDPTKKKSLLNSILQYNLNRRETKQIIDLFHNYLHLGMDEAVAAVLLKRERQKMYEKMNQDDKDRNAKNPVKTLINSLNNTGEKIEEVMAEVGSLDKDEKETVLDHFLYIYQLMEIMIPGVEKYETDELIQKVKEGSLT